MKHRTTADRISACLQTLILDEPFFGSLALQLKYEEDSSADRKSVV